MAWTTPRTWTNPEIVTDAIMNAHVRDNLRELERLAGVIIKTGSGTTGTGTVLAVSFGFTFPATPVVFVNGEVANPQLLAVSASGRTTTGFNLNIGRNTGTTSFPFSWVAIYVP